MKIDRWAFFVGYVAAIAVLGFCLGGFILTAQAFHPNLEFVCGFEPVKGVEAARNESPAVKGTRNAKVFSQPADIGSRK